MPLKRLVIPSLREMQTPVHSEKLQARVYLIVSVERHIHLPFNGGRTLVVRNREGADNKPSASRINDGERVLAGVHAG